ncbi:hypothetical protein BH10PSE19_BH10PSE19_11620 [soil metagenome]
MTIDTIIFAGPTITEEEIHRVLPRACCHDPVACGDIIRVLRLQPKTLVIIDGYFEQRGAVWHKEILMALEQGVTVYGASSMGALRAAELDIYGMIGFGEIYAKYQSAEIIDDDEVTVTHSTNQQYAKTITALINDRFTLRQAVIENIITQDQANVLLTGLKVLPYFSRSLFVETKKLALDDLAEWLQLHYIDQKKNDAIALLKQLATHKVIGTQPQRNILKHTFFSKKIYQEIASSTFKKAYTWLPEVEKMLITEADKHLIYLARLMHIIADLKQQGELLPQSDSLHKIVKYYLIYTHNYLQFKETLSLGTLSSVTTKPENIFNSAVLIAKHFVLLITYLQITHTSVSTVYKQLFMDNYRKSKNLLSLSQVEQWRIENDLVSEADFHDFVEMMTVFHFIVEKNNIDYLDIATTIDYACWLQDAQKLSVVHQVN